MTFHSLPGITSLLLVSWLAFAQNSDKIRYVRWGSKYMLLTGYNNSLYVDLQRYDVKYKTSKHRSCVRQVVTSCGLYSYYTSLKRCSDQAPVSFFCQLFLARLSKLTGRLSSPVGTCLSSRSGSTQQQDSALPIAYARRSPPTAPHQSSVTWLMTSHKRGGANLTVSDPPASPGSVPASYSRQL